MENAKSPAMAEFQGAVKDSQTYPKNRHSGGMLWLHWTAMNTIGGIVGGLLGHLLFMSLVALAPWLIFFIPGMTAAVVGFVLGLSQWLVLRLHLPRANRSTGYQWVLGTTFGALAGVAVVGFVGFAASGAVLFPFVFSSTRPLDPVLATYGATLTAVVLGSGTIALAQWIVLQEHKRDALWWMPAYALSWTIGVILGSVIVSKDVLYVTYTTVGSGAIVHTVVTGSLTFLTLGATTGFLLFYMKDTDAPAQLAH